jgi:epsilon-lactone hydrolase
MSGSGSTAIAVRFRALRDHMAANPGMDLDILRCLFDDLADLTAEPEGVTYAEVDAGGTPALWCLPQDRDAGRFVLYTHGGGFVANSASSHRKLAGHLAKAAGVAALVVDYRRAPEHPFPAQLEDATNAYRWLRGESGSTRVAVVGDSAGGNLAVALGVRLRAEGLPLPDALIAFSPWLDMEHGASTLDDPDGTDALIDRGLTTLMAQLYLGEGGSPTDPQANPLHADLTGFPPLYVAVGGAEALLDDSRRLVDRARAAGVEVEFEIAPDQQHIYPLGAGRDPQADATVKNAAGWLRSVLDRPTT